jgi:allantoate deiminase
VTRVEQRLETLYRIGGGEGANRPALSPFEEEAHVLVRGWMEESGLTTGTDAIGNLYGRLPGRRPELGEVWCGSHLDSVPRGGRYDGTLGVLAGLEAVSRLSPAARTIAVVAFRDEEGWRFGNGFLGSRAVTGGLTDGDLDIADRDGVSVRDALAAGGRELTSTAMTPAPLPAAFVEAHIEQGPVLAALDAPLGIVSGIVGIVELTAVFEGRAGHAGTTPMTQRRDAALCAAAFQVEAAAAVRRIPDAVVTVGSGVHMQPGATNVIARRASFRIDARAPDSDRLAALEAALRDTAERVAAAHGCGAEIDVTMRVPPAVCDDGVRAALRRAAPAAPDLPSGAGHDAQVLAQAGVPTGMLFVRSLNGGISHAPEEAVQSEDIDACVDALTAALRSLADTDAPGREPSGNA